VLNLLPSQRPQIKLTINCDTFPLLYASSHRPREVLNEYSH
jgi:hypothetical protein